MRIKNNKQIKKNSLLNTNMKKTDIKKRINKKKLNLYF